jgi:FG-GAP-like repeat
MPTAAQATSAEGFGPPFEWSSTSLPGMAGVGFVATDLDFDNDVEVVGCAGLDGVWVMQSLRTSFRAPARWYSGNWCGQTPVLAYERPSQQSKSLMSPRSDSVWEIAAHTSMPDANGWFGPKPYRLYLGAFTSSLGTFAGDVNNDDHTDLIAIHDTEYRVLIGNVVHPWGARPPTVGGSSTLTGDVDGDGLADLVTVDADGVRVVLGGQGQFLAPVSWSAQPFQGDRETLVGDVNADGDTDLIAIDDDGVRVLPSTGSAFGPPEQWSVQPFFGARATLAGDLDADGDADLIAVDGDRTMVMLAS